MLPKEMVNKEKGGNMKLLKKIGACFLALIIVGTSLNWAWVTADEEPYSVETETVSETIDDSTITVNYDVPTDNNPEDSIEVSSEPMPESLAEVVEESGSMTVTETETEGGEITITVQGEETTEQYTDEDGNLHTITTSPTTVIETAPITETTTTETYYPEVIIETTTQTEVEPLEDGKKYSEDEYNTFVGDLSTTYGADNVSMEKNEESGQVTITVKYTIEELLPENKEGIYDENTGCLVKNYYNENGEYVTEIISESENESEKETIISTKSNEVTDTYTFTEGEEVTKKVTTTEVVEAEITSGKIFTVNADKAITEVKDEENKYQVQETVANLYKALQATENFGIYADSMTDNCSHVEGYIAVNQLNGNSDFYMKELNKVTDGLYSYIGENNKTGNVWENGDSSQGFFITGDDLQNPDVLAQKAEAHGMEVDTILKEVDIDANLEKIAETGEAVQNILSSYDQNATKGTAAIGAIADFLVAESQKAEPTITANDTIVVDISASELNGNNGQDGIQTYLNKLAAANKNILANIIINVHVDEKDATAVSVYLSTNGGNEPDHDASWGCLRWNFGSYNGTINVNAVGFAAGMIMAPNATVNIEAKLQGGIIADTYVRNWGSETHQPYINKIPDTKVVKKMIEKEEEIRTKYYTGQVQSSTTTTESFSKEKIHVQVVTTEGDIEESFTVKETVTPPSPPKPEPEPPKPEPTPEPPKPTPPVVPEEPKKPEEPTPAPLTPSTSVTPKESTPVDSTPVTIVDGPVPLTNIAEIPGIGGDVLGAFRDVLGVRATRPKGVLGERRGPETGDDMNLSLWFGLLFLCMVIIAIIPICAYKRNK